MLVCGVMIFDIWGGEGEWEQKNERKDEKKHGTKEEKEETKERAQVCDMM